jgi:hypothetical protein
LAVAAGVTFALNNILTKLAYQTDLSLLSFLVYRTALAAGLLFVLTRVT